MMEALSLLPVAMRVGSYIMQERKKKKEPIFDLNVSPQIICFVTAFVSVLISSTLCAYRGSCWSHPILDHTVAVPSEHLAEGALEGGTEETFADGHSIQGNTVMKLCIVINFVFA